MGMTLLSRRLVRLAVAGVLAMVAAAPTAGLTLAADPVLSRPTVTARFLSNIEFTGTATLFGTVRRLEIVVDLEGSTRSIVADLGPPRVSGRTSLNYILETPGGGIAPNTDVSARFRAVGEDGTTVDGPSVTIHYEDTRYDWRTLTGDLVTVHWTEGGAAFGRRALRIAEDAVTRVADLLGVMETDPIDFYVYSDDAAFYDILGPGVRENVGGFALSEIRTLFASIRPDDIDDPWVGIVLPHELTHLVFDTAIRNPYHDPLRWLNEGVATYLSKRYGFADRSTVEGAVESGALLPLQALAGLPPTQAEQFHLAYAEYASAVDFLVRRYGEDALVRLVRSYAEGVTDDEAFRAALGTDVAGFEAAWLDDLGAEVPHPYGPVDAPPGPVPSDWIGEGAVPGEIPDITTAPGPIATAAPAAPAPNGSEAAGGPGLVAGLVLFGLALAGAGFWLARRSRPVVPTPTAPESVDETGPDEPGLEERTP